MKNWKKLSKVLIPLSLFGLNCAFADGDGTNSSAMLADSGMLVADCKPKPVCKPKPKCEKVCPPKTEICCECYSPQYYTLKDASGVFITADFLYWYSRETNLTFAEKYQMLSSFSTSTIGGAAVAKNFACPNKHFHMDAPWKPGVRVGLGLTSEDNGWDLYLNWTYYTANLKNSANADFNVESRAGEFGLYNPWINGSTLLFNDYNKVTAKWSLNFNQLDLELGKKFWLSRRFTVRPYAGIRAAWTKTHFDVTDYIFPGGFPASISDPALINYEEIDSDKYTNKYWGVGLLAGVQPSWMLGTWSDGNFSIFGNLEVAAIWGEFKGKHFSTGAFASEYEGDLAPVTFADTRLTFSSNEKVSQMVGIIDTALGLRWEQHWDCDRFSSSIDLGWEHHYWINHGLRHQSNVAFLDDFDFTDQEEQFYLNSNSIVSDLVFGGLVLRARFDF